MVEGLDLIELNIEKLHFDPGQYNELAEHLKIELRRLRVATYLGLKDIQDGNETKP